MNGPDQPPRPTPPGTGPPPPGRRALLRTALALGATAATAAATACTAPGRADGRHAPVPAAPATPAPTASRPAAADWPALGRGLDGPLVRPDDSAYATARQLYNTRFDSLKPAAVAYVRHEDDIRTCLAFARSSGVPVAIRSGGHAYTGWSSGDGRLVVDVSSLARAGGDGVIGAGARLVDVYRSLAAHGRTVPGGSCPTVAISGLTLGGGHGVASRAYGLTCDSLTAATLVTADGRTLTADATHHPDLFWALRGGGNGNFGVVTELRFRTHPAPRTVVAYLTWPWSRARAVLDAWQRWGPDQPDEIWSAVNLGAGPGGVDPTFTVSAFSLGGYGELQNALDRLADRAGASASSVSLYRRGYEEAMLVHAGCAGLDEDQCRLPGSTPGRSREGALRRETYVSASDFYDRVLSPAGVRALLDRAEAFTRIGSAEGGSGSVILTALGGATNRVGVRETAFVHRNSRVLAQYVASWSPDRSGAVQRAWLKTTHGAMRRHASGAAYQNYPDPLLTNWREAYYGPAADRLRRVKGRYDPKGLFSTFPQAI
ncbi:FAD-binding oxidoreductase [Streptomyces pratensis]|uniref:FAD-binding oxidoreductase n=1 Tax=Streptomyces pratensis TaxID=1169025 RepID=UPI00301AB834